MFQKVGGINDTLSPTFQKVWGTCPPVPPQRRPWWRQQICIIIDNGSNTTVGGRCYSAHQAVKRFAEHQIDMVSCVHRKCLSPAGVSGDINKTFQIVTITDSEFSNRVVV